MQSSPLLFVVVYILFAPVKLEIPLSHAVGERVGR
jgi:hypothetical protein